MLSQHYFHHSASSPTTATASLYVPPDPDQVRIVRLYLEKYELLTDEDRALYRQAVRMILWPAMIVQDGTGAKPESEKEPAP